jgi:hypothetical protein
MEASSKPQDQSASPFTTEDHQPDRFSVIRQFLKPDELRFLSLCEKDQFYAEFMARLRIPVRDWVKERFFEYAYGRNHFQSTFKAVFTGVFPNVAEVIRLHKRKDYTFLPCLMQSIEANFIINTVCRRLMNEFPLTPVLTIHDCLLTTPPHADTIQRVMREEFDRLGLAPSFHVKRYEIAASNAHQIAQDGPESDPAKGDGPKVA